MSTTPDSLPNIVQLLDANHAEDLRVLDISEVSSVADVFVIATGTSTPHLRALGDELQAKLRDQGIKSLRRAGDAGSGWVVLDYGDVIVHIMTQELREFYTLEQLWSDGKTIDPATLA